MGVEVEGVEELMFRLRQGGAKAVKHAIEHMRVEAREIRDLARDMAPVDEGDLEQAIKVREVGGGRGAGGRFVSKSLIIEVDGNQMTRHANKEGNLVPVGDYAYIMHEHLTPYGHFNLGKGSQDKQKANPGVMVGGKYLERAIAERERGLIGRIIEKVDDSFD